MLSAVTAVLYTLKDISAAAILLLVMRFIFLCNVKISRAAVFAVLMLFNAVFGSFFLMKQTNDYKAIMDFVSFVLLIALAQIVTDNKKISRSVLIVCLTQFTAEMFYSLFSPYLNQALYIECLFYFVLYVLADLLIWFGAKKQRFNLLPKIFEEIPKWVYGVLLLFELTCYYKEYGDSVGWYKVLYILSSMAVTVCVLFLVFKIFYLSYQQNDILSRLSAQTQYAKENAQGDEALRQFRHDYKNHMIVVNAYLESGKINEARQYLEVLNDCVNGVINKIRTGNFVSDAIINTKSVSALKSDIKIVFSGAIPPVGISDGDLCTVLANLVDNALEACEKMTKDKTVRIEAKTVKDYFVLSVSNPYIETPTLKTTKKDKKNHGIGLGNIKKVIKKYNGALSFQYENGIFTADVRMEFLKDKGRILTE